MMEFITRRQYKKEKMVILFFGPDGAGKTTQADLLVKYLSQNGVKVRKVWVRSLHTLAFIISAIFTKILGLSSPTEFRMKYRGNKWFRKIWLPIEFFSILPLVILRALIPSKLGYTIVAERFVVDWVVMMVYIFNDEKLLSHILSRILLSFIPANAKLIYIDANYSTIVSRRHDTTDSLEFIDFQRKYYRVFAERLKAMTIDTSKSNVNDTANLIKEYIGILE